MGSTETSDVATAERGGSVGHPVPAVLDWLIAAIVALVGMALIVAGSALVFAIDRPLIAEAVSDGTLTSDVLTGEEMVELVLAVATWTGAGLLVTGGLLLVGGVAYAIHRRRSRRAAAAGQPVSYFWTNAVLGAVTTVVASFLPFSPAIGGGVAGYLERGESERATSVGALSGLLAAAPLLVVLLFLLVGVVVGLTDAGEIGVAVVAGTATLLGLMVVAVVGAGLGAIGGFVGGKLAEDRS